MPKAYSGDLRARVIEAAEGGRRAHLVVVALSDPSQQES